MFWTRLFADPAALALQRQALEEGLLGEGARVENGQQALGVWLEAQAQCRFDEEEARAKKQGFKSAPHPDPWVQRSHYSRDAKGWFSPEALKVLEALIEKGADVTAPLPTSGITAVEMVCRLAEPEGFATVLRSPTAPPPSFFLRPLLPQENGPPESILAWAVRSHSPRYLECLYAHGVGLTDLNAQGQSWLCSAISPQVIQRLIHVGLDTTAVDRTGTSVLAHWVRQSVSPQSPVPEGLERNREWALLQLLRGVPSYLGTPQEKASKTKVVMESLRQSLFAHDCLPQLRIQDGKNWKAQWPVAVFFAKEQLASTRRVQSMRPLLELGAEQGWLEAAAQETVRGLPDRGWMALACWQALERSPYGTVEKALLKAGRALKSTKHWWLEESVLEHALMVSRKLSNRSLYRDGLVSAWEGWLGQVKPLENTQVPWPQAMEALSLVARLAPSKAVRPVGEFLDRWLQQEHASSQERMAWVRLVVPLVSQAGGLRMLLAACWPDKWQWPVDAPLPEEDRKLLHQVAALLPERSSQVAASLSMSRQLVLERALEQPSAPRRSVRL